MTPNLCSFLLAIPAQIFVVDVNGGPGVDFTQIQAAIDAAADGDVLLVKPGLYEQFALSKRLTVLAEPGAAARAVCRIQNLSADQQVVIDGLELVTLHVTNCSSAVLLSNLSIYPDPALIPLSSAEHLRVDECVDVRLHKSAIQSPGGSSGMEAVYVFDARLELAASAFDAQRGGPQGAGPAGDGGDALRVGHSARVQCVDSACRAGDGGPSAQGSLLAAGDGGDGVHVEAGGEWLAAASDNQRIYGGWAGASETCVNAGFAGDAVDLAAGASARFGGFQLFPGFSPCPGHAGLPLRDPGAGALLVAPIDPLLDVSFDQLGAQLTIDVFTPPQATGWLFLGRKPIVQVSQNAIIEELCTRDRTLPLGFSAAGGWQQVVVQLPNNLPTGFTLLAQAEFVDLVGGEVSRTNSGFITVR